MPSAMTLMKKLEINTTAKGIGSIALDAGIGFGASYGIGQAYHRYNDKWYGKNVARIAGGVGKGLAVVCSALAGGHQTFLGNAFNTVGQSGIDAIGLEMGLRHARKATGKKAVLIPATAQLPAGASEMTSIGALGRAAPGRGLTWDQIEEIATGR
jgi:hypothetical protein